MANVFWLTCPQCSKKFYAETSMLKIKTNFRCPFCELVFDRDQIEEEKEEKWQKI